ncbi:MAG: hypothetical protein IJT95_05675 [Abditibacteriota bacterium]|nr:hypothetical protein [Abditibacteriota bacterium]
MKTALIKRFSVLAALAVILAGFAAAAFADITVTSEADLAALCNTNVTQNVNIAGKTYDMTAYGWTPIRSLASGCTINGNGAVIDGINLGAVAANTWSGFVGENNGTISNVSVRSSSHVTVRANMGGIAAENKGVITNCVVYADTEGSVTISSTGGTVSGGIAGSNSGTISGCMVKNLAFSSTGADNMGGIAGSNRGTITRCYNYNTSIASTNGTSNARYGLIVGYNNGGSVSICSVEGCSVSTDGGKAGGIAGYVGSGSGISNTRVKNCDAALTGAGSVGGLFGYVYHENSYPVSVASCYFGGAKSTGITGTGYAGGIVGTIDSDSGTDNFLTKCFFTTDFSQPSAVAAQLLSNASSANYNGCAGVTSGQMTSLGWPAANLGTGWESDADLYPVYADANIRLVSISRPVKDSVPLNRNYFRVKVGDLNDISFVQANATINYSDFQLVDQIQDGTSITVNAFTVNGSDITGTVEARNFSTLNFSARVTNNTAAALQAVVTDYTNLYTAGLRMYTPASLATLKTAIDAANAALNDHYINITKTEADALTGAMHSASLDTLVCVVSFDAQNGSVQYGGSTVSSVEKEKNSTISLTAVPDSGYEFVCWKDSADNIIGSGTTLSYMVTRTTTVTAVFRSASSYIFTYKDNYGKTYKIQPVTDYSEVSYPAAEGAYLRTGYKVKSWTNDYSGEGGLPTSGEVTGDVTFTATLEHDDDTFTVKYKTNTAAEWVEGSYKSGRVFRATADASYGGNDFSYWKDQNGNTVSYERELSVTVYSAMEFTPYYEGAQSGVTVANLQSAVANSSTGKIAFTAQIVFGDDFGSEAYHGVLLLKSSSAVSDLDFNTSGVIVGKSSGYSAQTNTYIINKKNVTSGDTWYGRAFIVYYDTNNEMQIAFSDIKSATLN